MQNKVGVFYYTYNQLHYIEQGLSSVVMQQTSFPFQVHISDDASTDGQQEWLRNYATTRCEGAQSTFYDWGECITAHSLENPLCTILISFQKQNTFLSIERTKQRFSFAAQCYQGCQYWTICEGDDYWTDEYKLQKMTDFMDAHPDMSMCFHAVRYLYNDCSFKDVRRYDHTQAECDVRDAIRDARHHGYHYAKPSATMYHTAKYGTGFRQWLYPKNNLGDGPRTLHCFGVGKVGYIDKVMGVYRINPKGSWGASFQKKNVRQLNQLELAMIATFRAFDRWTHYRYHWTILGTILYHYKYIVFRQLSYWKHLIIK